MPMIRFRDLGKVGIVSDALAQDLPVNAVTDAFNVRFEGAKITAVGGWDLLSPNAAWKDEVPYTIASLFFEKGQYFVATNKHIRSVVNNPNPTASDPSTYQIITDVTPVGQTYDIAPNQRWNTTSIANRIVFNTPDHDPVGQKDGGDTTSPFETLKGWGIDTTGQTTPKTWRAKKIVAFSDVLMAINMTENNLNIPNRVRWSNLAYENQLPQDWIADDENTSGGFLDLMDANSPIQDAVPLRDYLMVYTKTETYMFQFVGGNDVFRNGRLYADSGILTEGCCVEVEGKHIVVTQNDVIIHDGSQKQSIAEGVIKSRLFKEFNSVNPAAVRVYKNTAKKEVWITYPYSTATTVNENIFMCNRAAVYNYQYGTWSFTEIPAVYQLAHILKADQTFISSWDESVLGSVQVTEEWDNGDNSLMWDAAEQQLATEIMIAPSSLGCIWEMDKPRAPYSSLGWDVNNKPVVNSIPMERWIRREYIDLDEATDEFTRFKTIRNCFPVVESENSFTFQFSTYRRVGGVLDKRAKIVFDAAHDYQVNTFASGRWLNYEIQSDGLDDWNFSGLDFDYVLEGRR